MRARANTWWQIVSSSAVVFASLLALFGLSVLTVDATRNARLLPELIALGAFAVPVGFVALVRDMLPGNGVPARALVTCFVCGGVIGTAAASLVEYDALKGFGVLPTMLVGTVEEPAKLVLPLIVFASGARRRTADGLLLGVASAMGFAAFETMGYALAALAGPHGSIGACVDVLLLRGALSPICHPAWTGSVCAALWWARGARDRRAQLVVPAVFLAAVLLHGAWDGLDAPAANVSVGLASALLLVTWIVVARRELRTLRPGAYPRPGARPRDVVEEGIRRPTTPARPAPTMAR